MADGSQLDAWVPDWPMPARVRSLQTGRHGGVSVAPWDSFNLGEHVGDEATAVLENRARLNRLLPSSPCWLHQVHGTCTVDLDQQTNLPASSSGLVLEGDASLTRQPGRVCGVMTADCLPVLLCDLAGTVVAAAHAGWRGLLAGVLENTVAAMRVSPDQVLAWLGPAIGPTAFRVGDEVRQAFVDQRPDADLAFQADTPGFWYGNLVVLARQRLRQCGVKAVYGGDACTFSQSQTYFSYRRDGVCGRMASLIWLDECDGRV